MRWRRRRQETQPVIFRRVPGDLARRPRYFLSLRWKALLPVLVVALVIAIAGTYAIVRVVADEAHQQQIARLQRDAEAVVARLQAIGGAQEREVTRIAYTEGVADQVAAGDGAALQPLLEPLAAAADLDFVLVTDSGGQEIIGLQRRADVNDYAVATDTDLEDVLPLRGTGYEAFFLRTSQGHALFTAGPVLRGDKRIGAVAVGQRLTRVLTDLRGENGLDLALYGADAAFLRTTLPFTDDSPTALEIPPETFTAALAAGAQVPFASVTLGDQTYNAAYVPFRIHGAAVGVLAVYVPDDSIYATATSRTRISLVSAGAVGLVLVLTFVVAGRFTSRVERVMQTAYALSVGDAAARTGMRAQDEIGELGATLDRLAARQQRRTDMLQRALREQRVEAARLNAVLESIPDGLVVQDLDGRVLLINDAARKLLGGQRAFRTSRLHELTAVVTETLGPLLAPGIYALGDPTRVALDSRMLQAQAAAITIRPDQKRIGTVIVLRDITADVEREQAREKLLDRLAERAVVPHPGRPYESLTALAREVVRNTRSIQQVIAELRDLSTFEPRDLEAGQQPLAVNELLWNIAAEWQPLARAARMRLEVKFGPRGRFVLGDDRRLRWAVGNLVDNAIKYSPRKTVIVLEARARAGDDALAEIAVIDQGYGLAPEDLDNAFTRFYRGTPRDPDGRPVRKPGTGQGLYIARRVIEAHGGSISLASRPGIGTTAVVALPLTAPVALELPGQAEAGLSGEPGDSEDDVALSRGGGYDTVPLEPRKSPWER